MNDHSIALNNLNEEGVTKIAFQDLMTSIKLMTDKINYSFEDLRNQIDTTDTYIEHYLPFRTLKEITNLLEQSFDRTTYNRINKYSAERIKELYARMLIKVNSFPDFKTRLIQL